MSDRLDEIRARLDAATPGPWVSACGGRDYEVHADQNAYLGGGFDGADADLVAHAPDDLRWLLAEVERLREINRELVDTHNANLVRHAHAEAEVERLRATLQRVEALADKWESDRLNTVIDKEAAAYLIRDALAGETP